MSETQTWYKVNCSKCGAKVRRKQEGETICSPCRTFAKKAVELYGRQLNHADTVHAIFEMDYSPTDRLGPPEWSESIESIGEAAFWYFTKR